MENKYKLTDKQIKILIDVAFVDAYYRGLSFVSRDAFASDLRNADIPEILKYSDIIREFKTWTYFKEVHFYFDRLGGDPRN